VSNPTVAIIGPGRMGQGLGLALTRAGREVILFGRTPRTLVPPLTLHQGDRVTAVRGAGLVLIATPDDTISRVATGLRQDRSIEAHHIVLHLSGLLDRRALGALDSTGAALGSFHPLQSVADPSLAPEQLAGSYAGIEGDERALQAGYGLATTLSMIPVRLPIEAKPLYHAGAVVAANYTVVLANLAEQLARSAGLPWETASKLYLPLISGTLANLESGTATALTGPVRRGDLETIRAHLAVLSREQRRLYGILGLAALRLAREAGLNSDKAQAVEALLGGAD
jgi:predicted short-subunit dehydrogenase-like oxidoreductase (DUF2520 family)